MEKLKYLLSLSLLSLAVCFSTQNASAQDEDAWAEAGEPEEDPIAEEAEADPTVEEESFPSETDEPVEAENQIEPPAAAAENDEKKSSFMDGLTFGMYADAYYNFTWNHVDKVRADETPHRGFVYTNGFALSFLGLDLAYAGDNFGITTAFRFGPSVPRLMGDIGDTYGSTTDETARVTDVDGNDVEIPIRSGGGTGISLENIKQVYMTWSPTDSFSIDFGQFDTIYGAEVAESYANLNYTRGALYYLMQPFYHTGLRLNYSVNDEFGLTALVVNGFNTPVVALKGNISPGIGLQAAYNPSENFGVFLGYFTLAGDEDNEDWDHFIDLVINAGFGDFSLVFNGDLWATASDSVYYGLSLALGYQVTDMFSIAVREELLHDPDNASFGIEAAEGATIEDVFLTTTTLTLQVKPSENLIFSFDNRIETSTEEIFAKGEDDFSKTWFTSTIGMVVKTD